MSQKTVRTSLIPTGISCAVEPFSLLLIIVSASVVLSKRIRHEYEDRLVRQ